MTEHVPAVQQPSSDAAIPAGATPQHALAPPTSAPPPRPTRATRTERLGAACLAALCLALLITGASLRPAAAGLGTHTQLGLPPCGWMAVMGLPCPTCGMTTAFSATVGGSYLAALRAQPLAALLPVATAGLFWGCLHVAAFGSRLALLGGTLLRPRIVWAVAALWAASWAYKIAVTGASA